MECDTSAPPSAHDDAAALPADRRLVLIGLLMLLAVFLWGTVLAIVAAVAAGRGEACRYPLSIRLVH